MTTHDKTTEPEGESADTRPEEPIASQDAPSATPYESDGDGLSAPSELSPRRRSFVEPMDDILRQVARARPMVPNSLEEGHAVQAVHEPAASKGRVDAESPVIIARSTAPRMALPKRYEDPERLEAPRAERVKRRPTEVHRRPEWLSGRILAPAAILLVTMTVGGAAAWYFAGPGERVAPSGNSAVPSPAERSAFSSASSARSDRTPPSEAVRALAGEMGAPLGSGVPAAPSAMVEAAGPLRPPSRSNRAASLEPVRSVSPAPPPRATSGETKPAADAQTRTAEQKRAIDHGAVVEEP